MADVMDPEIVKFDPLDELTDILYFYGASNVQKCGRVLQARHRHPGEHVISLFFSGVAKLGPIKVRMEHLVLFSRR